MRIQGLILVTSLLISCGTLFAQGTTSRVLGVVQDPSGALVADATVKLTNEGTGVAFTTNSSSAGAYVFEAVQPGSYAVQVEAAGFRRFVSTRNPVTIGPPATINGRLQHHLLPRQSRHARRVPLDDRQQHGGERAQLRRPGGHGDPHRRQPDPWQRLLVLPHAAPQRQRVG